ncbi:BTB-kelch protein [Parasponia andersonii]|uniref:BTB-kelch protein n=1 Tax=Parasponia andersonii TaxID=3476 RepID=A0A2P5E4W4_PARAD|nr:BTB-kelch protein [Parasponia andersonii]
MGSYNPYSQSPDYDNDTIMNSETSSSASNSNPLLGFRIYMCFYGKDPSAPKKTMSSNWIEYYEPSNNTCRRLCSIPGLIENHVLKGFTMVAVADSIFIIGGKLCRNATANDEDDVEIVDLEVQSSVLRYNLGNNTWSKCAPLRVPRFDFACAVGEDGKVYVAGGKCALGSGSGVPSAEVYDPGLDEWAPLPDMSTPRYKCVGVTWRGRIHVVGGFAGVEGSFAVKERCSADVLECDRATWNLVEGMWQLDVPPNQIVAVEDKLFSSGDCLNAWKGHIEVYDGKLGIWNEVDGSNFEPISSPVSTSDATRANWPPMRRLYLTMAPIGTHLYFLVGHRKPGEIAKSISAVHVFDTSASGDECGWMSFEPVEEDGLKELCSHCCVGHLQVT